MQHGQRIALFLLAWVPLREDLHSIAPEVQVGQVDHLHRMLRREA